MKTEAGIDRNVPIHTKIRPLVERKYKEAVTLGSNYLFNVAESSNGDTRFTYDRYSRGFVMVRDELKLASAHRPHDGRTQFVTSAKKNAVDEYAIKYIVGHRISDITEKIYTKREIGWLREEIEKIR